MSELLEVEAPGVKIRVVYFLVRPEDGSDHEWWMLAGWDETSLANGHCGDACCTHGFFMCTPPVSCLASSTLVVSARPSAHLVLPRV